MLVHIIFVNKTNKQKKNKKKISNTAFELRLFLTLDFFILRLGLLIVRSYQQV